ncbi:DUF4411 family protein [Chloroflexota bacterium]
MHQKPDYIYCFDSSAFIDLNRYLIGFVPQLRSAIGSLFLSGRLISHEIVYREITTQSKTPDNLSLWISPKQHYFKNISYQQAVYVSEIISKFPTLIHYNKENDDADPWLIATILELKNTRDMFSSLFDYAVVSNESTTIKNRLPFVCKHYSIKHMDINEFISDNGWTISLQT